MSPKDVIVKAKYMNVIEHEADLFGEASWTHLLSLPARQDERALYLHTFAAVCSRRCALTPISDLAASPPAGCYLTQLSGLPHNSCLSALDKLRDSDAVLAALGEKERARRMEAYEDHPPVKTRKEHILGRLESPRNRTLRYLETSADGTLYYEVGSIGLRRPQQEVDGAVRRPSARPACSSTVAPSYALPCCLADLASNPWS